jgi:hypothetical protein
VCGRPVALRVLRSPPATAKTERRSFLGTNDQPMRMTGGSYDMRILGCRGGFAHIVQIRALAVDAYPNGRR